MFTAYTGLKSALPFIEEEPEIQQIKQKYNQAKDIYKALFSNSPGNFIPAGNYKGY